MSGSIITIVHLLIFLVAVEKGIIELTFDHKAANVGNRNAASLYVIRAINIRINPTEGITTHYESLVKMDFARLFACLAWTYWALRN